MEPFCSCNSNQICKTVSFSNQILGVVKSRRTIQKYLVQHYVVCLLLTSEEAHSLSSSCATMKRWEIKNIMCRQLEIWELLSESKRAGIVWVGSRPISAAYLHTFTAFIVFIASNALLEIFPLSRPRTTSWHFNFARNGLAGYECTNRVATLDLQNQKKIPHRWESGIEFWSLAAGGGWLCRLWRAEAVEHGGESGIKEIEEI